jgi:hypothetical protein
MLKKITTFFNPPPIVVSQLQASTRNTSAVHQTNAVAALSKPPISHDNNRLLQNTPVYVPDKAPFENLVPYTFKFCGKARSVHLAGSFNGWLQPKNGIIPLKESQAYKMNATTSDEWQITLYLPPGQHEFKYVLNGGEYWRLANVNTEQCNIRTIYSTEFSYSVLYLEEEKPHFTPEI